MDTFEVQKEKIIVTSNFCLGPGTQVLVGFFINYTPPSGHIIELRVLVGDETHFKNRTTGTILYIQQFQSIPLTDVVGNVTVPAQELLAWRAKDERPLDYRGIALKTILASELQEIHFDLDRTKMTCELWFKCIKTHPRSVIAKHELNRERFFCPAG